LQGFQIRGNLATVFMEDPLAEAMNMPGLVSVETRRVDELLDLGSIRLSETADGRKSFEEGGRSEIDAFVRTLRAQDYGNAEFMWLRVVERAAHRPEVCGEFAMDGSGEVPGLHGFPVSAAGAFTCQHHATATRVITAAK